MGGKAVLRIAYSNKKNAIVLHFIYNNQIPKANWIDLDCSQILTSLQTKFKTLKSNNFKIGNNKLVSNVISKLCFLCSHKIVFFLFLFLSLFLYSQPNRKNWLTFLDQTIGGQITSDNSAPILLSKNVFENVSELNTAL